MTDHEKVAKLVAEANGRVVGRTRLQKTAYLLEAAGLGDGFRFSYKHYGPYSEQLATAISRGDLVQEEEKPTNWGGTYSIYTAARQDAVQPESVRRDLIALATAANPVALELAATAVYFALAGESDPWAVTAVKKAIKARDYLETAKCLYDQLRLLPTPVILPMLDSSTTRSVGPVNREALAF
jgi:uncharacterized protein YwgA